jgi:aromatic ring-opening dioxygenase catalytic subunit (LigB family)
MFWMPLPPDFQAPVSRMGEHFAALGRTLRPKAVLMISAHWEARDFAVAAHPRPAMIYDYGGFPPETYRLQYPAPGAPELAARIHGMLAAAGLPSHLDGERGFDHGVFVPLMKIFPEADIPVVQVSLRRKLDVESHQALGRALAPLRRDGVLIIGSGSSYHNLGRFGPDYGADSDVFDRWLSEVATDPDPRAREARWRRWQEAPHARLAHPREEHLLPLFVVSAAAEAETGQKIFGDHLFGVAMSSFQFGAIA